MDAPLYGQVQPQYLFSVILQNIRNGYVKLGLTQLRTFMGYPLNPEHLNKNTGPSTTSVALYHPLHRKETSLFSKENPFFSKETSASLFSYSRPHSPAFNTSMNPPPVFQSSSSENVNSAHHFHYCSYYPYIQNPYNQSHYQPVTYYYHHKDVPDYIVIDIPPFYSTFDNGFSFGNLPNYYTQTFGSVDLV